MTLLVENIEDVRKSVAVARKAGKQIGLVPTMGALHKGHLSLVRRAAADGTFTVVSIFVNPTQFGPDEDIDRYPRPLEADLDVCRAEGVDLVFAPEPGEMFPGGFCTHVEVEGMGEVMCGALRPGHFRGVTTVVAKLFDIVQPDVAYFGRKDAQQGAIIRRMVADLDLPVAICMLPTVRDADGLATSSRNAHLAPEERCRALVLSRALKDAESMLRGGCTNADKIEQCVRKKVEQTEGVELQYVAVVDPDTLEPLQTVGEKVLVALAAMVGKTRLIDNVLLRDL
jgi:pantoate--beta-alanine ligase